MTAESERGKSNQQEKSGSADNKISKQELEQIVKRARKAMERAPTTVPPSRLRDPFNI